MFFAAILLAACTVTEVHDGDTLTATCPKRAHELVVRVAEIDAPEYPAFGWGLQPGAKAAQASAAATCPVGSTAALHLSKYDKRTSRWIAHVTCGGLDLSAIQAASGNAWSYLPAKGSKIPGLVAQAKASRIGLWAADEPIAPSVWRSKKLR